MHASIFDSIVAKDRGSDPTASPELPYILARFLGLQGVYWRRTANKTARVLPPDGLGR